MDEELENQLDALEGKDVRHNDLSATGFYGAAATLAVFIIGGWLTAHDASVRLTEQVAELNRHVLAIETSVNRLDIAIRPYPKPEATMFVPDATRVMFR